MKTKRKIKLRDVKAAAEAMIAVAILVATVTIVAEMWSPLKDLLKNMFMHHWLGKSALAIGTFVVVYWFRKDNSASGDSVASMMIFAVWASFVAAFAMILFFVLHTYGIV